MWHWSYIFYRCVAVSSTNKADKVGNSECLVVPVEYCIVLKQSNTVTLKSSFIFRPAILLSLLYWLQSERKQQLNHKTKGHAKKRRDNYENKAKMSFKQNN